MQKEIADFTYYNPVRIEFGKDKIKELPSLIPSDKKVLITYGGGSVKRFGTLDRVRKALSSYTIGEFGGIEANPTFETCMAAVEKIHNENYDYLLAVGGGSVIDGTKFIAAAAEFKGDPINIFGSGIGKGQPIKSALPLGTILTLPATGTEMNETSVISFKSHKAKVSFKDWNVYPVFSILEPELTYTLPKRQLANGLTDSFIHVIEQYLTYPVGAKIQDKFAESVLRTLIEIGSDVIKEDNHDYSTRANFMWAATVALNRSLSTGVPGDWSTHALGHELTVFNNTDHARTLSAILPSVMLVRREAKHDKLIQYAEEVWGITGSDDEAKIDKAILKTVDFFKTLDMPVSLTEIDVTEQDIDQLVDQLERHGRTAISERGDQTLEISRAIYQKALVNAF